VRTTIYFETIYIQCIHSSFTLSILLLRVKKIIKIRGEIDKQQVSWMLMYVCVHNFIHIFYNIAKMLGESTKINKIYILSFFLNLSVHFDVTF
jgi:hypothetical protein